jgi:hypothetical protein
MKQILLGVSLLLLAGVAGATPEPKPVRVVLSPNSTVFRADLVKHFVDKCPNVSVTLDPKLSDYMLDAWGWSGNYKFTLYKKGGEAVYSTSTVMMSNAVKDVCKFINVEK